MSADQDIPEDLDEKDMDDYAVIDPEPERPYRKQMTKSLTVENVKTKKIEVQTDNNIGSGDSVE